jgi:hypothetical protein
LGAALGGGLDDGWSSRAHILPHNCPQNCVPECAAPPAEIAQITSAMVEVARLVG